MFQVIPEVDMAMNDEHDPSLQSSPVSWYVHFVLDLNVYRIFEAVPGDHMHKSLRIGMEATLLFKGIKAPVMLLSMQFCEVVTRPESSSQLMVSYLDSEDGLPSMWSTGNASLALF
ncbi:hypothetical protein SDJN03_03324, partial [Cucurbita argyrosperma subsp. sororia]